MSTTPKSPKKPAPAATAKITRTRGVIRTKSNLRAGTAGAKTAATSGGG